LILGVFAGGGVRMGASVAALLLVDWAGGETAAGAGLAGAALGGLSAPLQRTTERRKRVE